MSVGRFLQQAAAGAGGGDPVYVDDVFSTYLYTGNGSTQTITNGIDLDGEGGMVWIKQRTGSESHNLFDTDRTGNFYLLSDATNGNTNAATANRAISFNSEGFSLLGSDTMNNGSGQDYTSWAFRKQPGFFDVVTWTGDGVSGRAISHSLGSAPGMIIIKRTSGSDNWNVWHRSLSNPQTKRLYLNASYAEQNQSTPVGQFGGQAPTSTEFYVGSQTEVNYNGQTYVAYLFAHDDQRFGTDSDESIIKCGTYTGNPVTVDLGWEPQWILLKKTTGGNNWFLYDTMRGWQTSGTGSYLQADATAAEVFTSLEITKINSTGVEFHSYGGTWVYVAIRRPHKPASEFAATNLFAIDTSGGTSPTPPAYVSGFPVDMELHKNVTGNGDWRNGARLIQGKYLATNNTNAEGSDANMTAFDYQNGFRNSTSTSSSKYAWMFRRAPGFFDVVAYTGQSAEIEISHNLGVTPELIIQKCRTQGSGYNWNSWYTGLTNSQYINLNTTAAVASSSNLWGTNSTVATDSIFRVGSATTGVNGGSSNDHIAYLFATVPGISKVGTYTGSGSTQTIDCGFSNGARFVLIKCTSGSANWYLWDSERGITSGLDNYIIVNQTAAQTTNSPVDVNPASSGFEVFGNDSDSNRNNETYLFLAIA
jgi:hypothetical protein